LAFGIGTSEVEHVLATQVSIHWLVIDTSGRFFGITLTFRFFALLYRLFLRPRPRTC
jgi:hypothetical protein